MSDCIECGLPESDHIHGGECPDRQGRMTFPTDLPGLDTMRTFSMEVQFQSVDPEVLALITGGAIGNIPTNRNMIEVRYRLPARRRAWRVVWEWLTRTPRQYTDHFIGVPYAEVSRNPDGSMTFYPVPQDWGCGPFHPPESE